MAEIVHLVVDDGSGRAYDLMLDATIEQTGETVILTKDRGTVSGAGALMVAFDVRLPDGSAHRAQCVTTIASFLAAARLILGRYDESGRLRGPTAS